MNLREHARGKSCYLRFDGCVGGNETTVLCHLRIGGIAGIAQKPADICAVPGCVVCHSILDGRIKSDMTMLEMRGEVLRALCQWLADAWVEGLVKTA